MRVDAPRSRSPPRPDVAGLFEICGPELCVRQVAIRLDPTHDPIAFRDYPRCSLCAVGGSTSGDGSSEKGYVMVKLRSLRKPLLTLLALLIAFASVQFGPGAATASAGDKQHCPPFSTIKRTAPGDGLTFEFYCTEFLSEDEKAFVWNWELIGVKPKRTERRTVWQGGRTSPPYMMILQGLISDSHAGGAAGGMVTIQTPSGDTLNRRIAILMRIQYYRPSTGWGTCRNSVWHEAPTERSWYYWSLDNGTVPDCGNGSYRTQVYGRFFSVSLNRWEQRGPIYSPAVTLPPPV